MRKRIVYYSKRDMLIGSNLDRIEAFLSTFDEQNELDVNAICEFYNIKLYFDNDLYLLTWDDNKKENFKNIIDGVFLRIREFWSSKDSKAIIGYLGNIETAYKKTYWQQLVYFQVYKKINAPDFSTVLSSFPFEIYHILSIKILVDHFESEVRLFLLSDPKTAEFLLSNTEVALRNENKNLYFPKSLSQTDKEQIILNYINSGHPNLNYIRLIENSKDADFKLSPKTRLKARKKSEELNDSIFEKGTSQKLAISVAYSPDQVEPLKILKDAELTEYSYGALFLDQITNNFDLFSLFKHLFVFIDSQGLINLTSKRNEMVSLEKIIMRSKNEYFTGYYFNRKNILSNLQLISFESYLGMKNNSIEKLIISFIHDYLIPEFQIIGLRLQFGSENLNYLEKIRVLAPELESLLKQYQLFVKDNEINFELLEINSNPIRFSEICSLNHKKYAYPKEEALNNLMHIFFSDQCLAYYIKPFESKYNCLYDLLTNEKVQTNQFEDYQGDIINELINMNEVMVDQDKCVIIKNELKIYLIGQLYNHEVISYWNYPEEIRVILDEMEKENLIYFEDTLFSKQEINYLNFYLNKKEYTNGRDLRNKYLHGTNPYSKEQHKSDYHALLKLLILILFKIDDDLTINKDIERILK